MEPISLLIKPASGNCNMRCQYCFYEDEMNHRSKCSYGMMSEEILEKVIRNTLKDACYNCTFAFQGGEPTLVGLDYYRKVIEYVERYNVNACRISYAIQTNGYKITEEWAEFFHKHGFLVGISLDGYETLHNQYRIDSEGKGTFNRVMQSIEYLKNYKVEFNVLTVVHKETSQNASKIYNFYKRNQLMYQQYIECLEPIDAIQGNTPYALLPEDYAFFLKKLFDKWYRDMMKGDYVYIRYFENLLMILNRQQPESCNMIGKCGKQWVVEADGSVYPCDFYVLDEWKLGNLTEDSIETIESRRKELRFIEVSMSIPEKCKGCKWYGLCRNGCRRNCEPITTSSRNINYFCNAYQSFFEYAYPRLVEVLNKLKG